MLGAPYASEVFLGADNVAGVGEIVVERCLQPTQLKIYKISTVH